MPELLTDDITQAVEDGNTDLTIGIHDPHRREIAAQLTKLLFLKI